VKRFAWTADCAAAAASAKESAIANCQFRAEEIGAEIGAQQARLVEQGLQAAVLSSVEVAQDHQRQARRGVVLASSLLRELGLVTVHKEDLELELGSRPLSEAARATLFERALSFKSRVDALDKCAAAMAKLVAIERQAHDLDTADARRGSELDELLKRLHAERMEHLEDQTEIDPSRGIH
jgi:hypothetical protein